MNWLKKEWSKNTKEPIDMIGHSRGGYIVVEVARAIQKEGIDIGGCIERPRIRWMGLYDPVDSAPGYGEAETVPANVDSAEVTFPDEGTTTWVVGPKGQMIPVKEYPLSRWYFNRADGGAEDPSKTRYHVTNIAGTHAGLGGDPWGGDHPGGKHSRANDNSAAERADRAVRTSARAAGVQINLIGNYGY
jgi:hypothetical protein